MTDHLRCECENNRTITILENIGELFYTEQYVSKISY